MHKKIHYLRNYYKLQESYIANLVFMNCYKYKRCESGSMPFSVEDILLLSIIFDIPFDYLALDKYSVNDIISYISRTIGAINNEIDILHTMQKNLVIAANSNTKRINYSLKEKCVNVSKNNLSRCLYQKRIDSKFESFEIADKIDISLSEYDRIEGGAYIPDIMILYELSSIFNCTIEFLLKENPGEV